MAREVARRPVARSTASRSRSRLGRWIVLLAASLAGTYLAGSYAIPRLETANGGTRSVARLVYAPVCHQLPSRSLEVSGRSAALCSRCSGLYLGGTLGLLLATWFVLGKRPGPHPVWLAAALAPTVIDALLPRVGMPALGTIPRLFLAVPAGMAAGLFLAIGIDDWIASREQNRSRRAAPSRAALEDCDG